MKLTFAYYVSDPVIQNYVFLPEQVVDALLLKVTTMKTSQK